MVLHTYKKKLRILNNGLVKELIKLVFHSSLCTHVKISAYWSRMSSNSGPVEKKDISNTTENEQNKLK